MIFLNNQTFDRHNYITYFRIFGFKPLYRSFHCTSWKKKKSIVRRHYVRLYHSSIHRCMYRQFNMAWLQCTHATNTFLQIHIFTYICRYIKYIRNNSSEFDVVFILTSSRECERITENEIERKKCHRWSWLGWGTVFRKISTLNRLDVYLYSIRRIMSGMERLCVICFKCLHTRE